MHFSDEQPFLDAISARYHDDGPRLVYADFLDDSGDPARAELVRLQLALSRLPEDHPRRPELAERQADLLAAHAADWIGPLRTLVTGVEFRRGLPDSVSMDAGTFLSDGADLFRLVRVRRLRLLDAASVLPKLVESPLLGSVAELDLCGNELGDDGLARLARSPYLAQLRSLDLGFNGLGDAGVAALSRASTLGSLTTLALNDNTGVTCAGVAALAESPFFAGLTSLDLSGNDVNEYGVRSVVAGKSLPRLHTLRLKGNPIGDTGLALLAASGLFPRLLSRSPQLELRDNGIGPVGVTALTASPALLCCRTLDLTGNEVGDRGFAALAASPRLEAVRTLRLARNQITDAGLSAVRQHLARLMARLRSLDLSGNRLTRHGFGLLHGARGESGVLLDLSGNVQSSVGGEAPVRVGDVVPEVLQGVAEAAALRRRIAHPRTLPPDRPTGG